MVTDGEQRRDNYASFVGGRLDNCQLIPLSDLTAIVDDPAEFEEELRVLDVPASEVRHPVVYGALGRSRPLALHELEFVASFSRSPVKVALPGPYLLTRMMWLDCLTDRPYETREDLARDVVRVLREEAHFLLASGAALVQFDEPVLMEVVHGSPGATRSFMCGALSERLEGDSELDFAAVLLEEVVRGLPRESLALHVCRGNWTPDESGGPRRRLPAAARLPRTRAGGHALPRAVDAARRRDGRAAATCPMTSASAVGGGQPEDRGDRGRPRRLSKRIRRAIDLFGEERVLLTPDCGFATFADNPVASSDVAEAKLRAIVEARDRGSRRLKPPRGSTPLALTRAAATLGAAT